MLTAIIGSGNGRRSSAPSLLPSPTSRQTKPGMRSAAAFTRPRLSTKSAMRGSSIGYRSRPILSSATCMLSLRGDRRHGAVGIGVVGVLIDPFLDHVAEVADEALHRPGRRIAQGADRVPLDLLGHLEQHVDLALLGAALDHAFHHP